MQKTKSEIIPHYESHWGTQNQMRLENYPQCATQCATQWDSQKHMKRAIDTINVSQTVAICTLSLFNSFLGKN